jgi:hypothetical protein
VSGWFSGRVEKKRPAILAGWYPNRGLIAQKISFNINNRPRRAPNAVGGQVPRECKAAVAVEFRTLELTRTCVVHDGILGSSICNQKKRSRPLAPL